MKLQLMGKTVKEKELKEEIVDLKPKEEGSEGIWI